MLGWAGYVDHRDKCEKACKAAILTTGRGKWTVILSSNLGICVVRI
jgi:hypothetical protein